MSEINPFFSPRLITNFKAFKTSGIETPAECIYTDINKAVNEEMPESLEVGVFAKSKEKFKNCFRRIALAKVALLVATRLDMLGENYYFYTDLPKLPLYELDSIPYKPIIEIENSVYKDAYYNHFVFKPQDIIGNYAYQCCFYGKSGKTELEVAFLRILNEHVLRLLKNYGTTSEILSNAYREIDATCAQCGFYEVFE